MKKTFRIIFDVEGDTCAEYKDLVDKFMLKQMDLAEELVKNVDQDEILKQSRMIISMKNEFYDWEDYEYSNIFCNEKGKEYADASIYPTWPTPYEPFTEPIRGYSGVSKEEWKEYIKAYHERWQKVREELNDAKDKYIELLDK